MLRARVAAAFKASVTRGDATMLTVDLKLRVALIGDLPFPSHATRLLFCVLIMVVGR